MERRAAARQLVDDGLVDGGDDAGHERVGLRHRRVGAHAAGVRAGVAVADPLVVARRSERHGALAVAQRQQRELLAGHELLHDHRKVAEAVGDEHVLERRARLCLVGGDHDALARREPVGLDHGRVAVHRGEALVHGRDDAMRRGGDARRGHDLLRERLRALQPRGGGERPEVAHARGPERIAEAGDERRLRPDDDEVDAGIARRGGERRGIAGRRVEHPRVAPDPCVPRHAQHLGRLRGAQQRADERVLAPAGPDDEDPHTAPMKSSMGIADSDS